MVSGVTRVACCRWLRSVAGCCAEIGVSKATYWLCLRFGHHAASSVGVPCPLRSCGSRFRSGCTPACESRFASAVQVAMGRSIFDGVSALNAAILADLLPTLVGVSNELSPAEHRPCLGLPAPALEFLGFRAYASGHKHGVRNPSWCQSGPNPRLKILAEGCCTLM